MILRRKLASSLTVIGTSALAVGLLAGCSGGVSSGADETSPAPQAVSAGEGEMPTVYYEGDYPGFESADELIAKADAVVTGEVVATKPYLLYPRQPTCSDEARCPQYGVPAEEIAKIEPIVTTILTFQVTQSLEGSVSVGDKIEILQMGGVSKGVKYVEKDTVPISKASGPLLVALSASEDGKQFGLLNPTDAAFKVSKGEALSPVDESSPRAWCTASTAGSSGLLRR